VRADNPLRPTLPLEVKVSGFFIGELLEELVEADGLGLVGDHWSTPELFGVDGTACPGGAQEARER